MEANKTVEELQKSLQKFGAFDYAIFVLMLVGCGLIGVYHAVWGKKSGADAADEYLMGGRKLKVMPVSMSLIATYISGITVLGNPTETYLHGAPYMYAAIGIVLSAIAFSYVFLPVFLDLRFSSTYEYLQRRFDRNVRLLGSVLFSFTLVAWLPIVIYVPALAFNQVTGVDVHLITPCVCVVCIFYTYVGGIKAVVWTDVVQTWLMLLGIFIVIIKGTIEVGGFGVVWERCKESGRLEVPSFVPDYTIRNSIWSVSFGAFGYCLQVGFMNQNMIQRYMSLPSLSKARKALWLFVIGNIVFLWASCYGGLLSYSYYHDCDPVITKLARAKDQIFPLLVMEVLGDFSGLSGMFVAGIFSASLSSLSTGLNSMSAVVLEDFVKPFTSEPMTERATMVVMKGVVLIFGALCLVLVYVVEKMGAILQLAMSLISVTSGPCLGIFCCGMLIPWANSKGTFYGSMLGLLGSGFIIIGAQNEMTKGNLKSFPKPLSIKGCDYIYNSTTPISSILIEDPDKYIFPLYKMSYLFYLPLGAIITIIATLAVSFFTGFTDVRGVDPRFFSPVIRKFLPKKNENGLSVGNEQEVVLFLKNNSKNGAIKDV